MDKTKFVADDDEVKLVGQDTSHSDIIMSVDFGKTEMLRLCSNGDIRVKGKLTTNDMEVVEAFKEFLSRVLNK